MTSGGSTEFARSAGAGFSEVIPEDEDRGGEEPLGSDNEEDSDE